MVLHGHAKTCLETSKNAWGWVVSCGKCKIIYKKESISKIAMVFAWAWNNIRWGSEMCLRVAIMSWKTQNYNKKLISTKVMVLAQACKIINWGLKYA
jgi:Zn-finger protein